MDDGQPPEQPSGWLLGDRYRVIERIGSGGMAEVFRAHDEQLDRDVAVKVFRTPVDEPGNATAPERREIELRALAQLSHPNLITLYDASIVDAHPAFLVMELVDGPNLSDRLQEGALPEPVVRVVGAQIADALAYVHALGMVHRDVKPANILLGTEGPDPETATIRARLSDFGIVRILNTAHLTADAFTLGTASYLAPEQVRGADVDAAADVYALGLVLIEALTGIRSFDGPIHEAMAARLARPPDIPQNLPTPWPALLAAMTRYDPATRPSAGEVGAALREPTTTFIPQVPPPPVGAPIPPILPPDIVSPELAQRRRFPVLLVAALAALAVIGTGLVIFLWPSSPSSSDSGPTTTPTAPSQSAKQSDHSGPKTSAGPESSGPGTSGPASSGPASSGPASSGPASSGPASSGPPPSRPPSSSSHSSTAPRSSPPRSPSSSRSRSSTSSSAAPASSAAPSTAAAVSTAGQSGVAIGSPSP